MADGFLTKKFLLDKRAIKMEDCILYIEQLHPEDKGWFYHLCVDEVELTDKHGNKTVGVRPWLTIKTEFYKKYFPATAELTRRMKLLSDWQEDAQA